MRGGILGVIIPTRWEASDVLRRFSFQRTGPALFKANIHSRSVLLCLSGVGRDAARLASGRLVSEGAKELVSMGFCGALVPTLKVGDLVTDRLATVDRPVRTPVERRRITERANALAADMETQAIIEAGTRHGVPIHILRVVSDGFQDDLTPLLGTTGPLSARAIAFRLLNPGVWPLAWKLRNQSRMASARLGDALSLFCSAAA